MLIDIDVAKRLDGYLKGNYSKMAEEIAADKINCGLISILASLQNVRPNWNTLG